MGSQSRFRGTKCSPNFVVKKFWFALFNKKNDVCKVATKNKTALELFNRVYQDVGAIQGMSGDTKVENGLEWNTFVDKIA